MYSTEKNKVSERNNDQCRNVASLEYMYSTERKQSAGSISCFFFDAVSFTSKVCFIFLTIQCVNREFNSIKDGFEILVRFLVSFLMQRHFRWRWSLMFLVCVINYS